MPPHFNADVVNYKLLSPMRYVFPNEWWGEKEKSTSLIILILKSHKA